MNETTTYTVSTFNVDSDFNTVVYRGGSILQADLAMMEAARENKHGSMVKVVIKENKEFSYYKKDVSIIKSF